MKTSAAGLAEIKRSEGVRLTAYRDAVGIWTIGYGHTTAAGAPRVAPGLTITQAQADAILARDIALFERGVESAVKVPLTQGQFDALVSFSFNLGVGALRKSTLLKKLNAGDYVGAAAEFARWNRAGGSVLKGLTFRRAREAAMFRGTGPGALPAPAKPKPAPSPAPTPETPPVSPWAMLAQAIIAILKSLFGTRK